MWYDRFSSASLRASLLSVAVIGDSFDTIDTLRTMPATFRRAECHPSPDQTHFSCTSGPVERVRDVDASCVFACFIKRKVVDDKSERRQSQMAVDKAKRQN